MSAVDEIRSARLVAILRRPDDVDASVARLAAAGVRVVEITLDTEDAVGAIRRLSRTPIAGLVETSTARS